MPSSGNRHPSGPQFRDTRSDLDPPLTADHLAALRKACAPVGLLSFPPLQIIRALRQFGYVEIVLGGVQITPSGLERLLRERRRQRPPGVPESR